MSSHSQSRDGRNNPWLDLVRSLAILLVLARHGERALHMETGAPQGFLQTMFMNGWIGVDLFFVLSGYLISRHLIRAGIGSGEFRLSRYVAMRALRIVPAYYAVLFLTAAGAFPLFYVAPEALGLRVAYHMLFLQDYLPSNINVVFWSLGVEEKFYLLAPVLILLLLRCRDMRAQAALLFAIIAMPVAMRAAVFFFWAADGMDYPEFWRMLRSPFHMALDGLVVGVGIAVAESAGIVRRSRGAGLALLLGATMVLAMWTGTHDFMGTISVVDAVIQPPLIALIAGAITLGGVMLAGTSMPFARPIKGIARLSYSLYLIHYPLIPGVAAVALPHGEASFWIGYLVASFFAAIVLHVAVERPFLLWKDRIAGRSRVGTAPRELIVR